MHAEKLVVTRNTDEKLNELRRARLDEFNNLLPELKQTVLRLLNARDRVDTEASRAAINFLEVLAKYMYEICRINEQQTISNKEKRQIVEDIEKLQLHYMAIGDK